MCNPTLIKKSPNVGKEAAESPYCAFKLEGAQLWKAMLVAMEEVQGPGSSGISTFLELFHKEATRLASFTETQLEKLELLADGFLSRTISSCRSKTFDVRLAIGEATALTETYLSFERHAAAVLANLTKIALRADKELGSYCLVALDRQRSSSSTIVIILSDVYETLRNSKTHGAAADRWVAPSTFERETIKYWIEKGKLTELLLGAAVEAPLLVYGKSGLLSAQPDTTMKRPDSDKLWDDLASSISSVYYDSPQMSLYEKRLARHEGAMLFRVRWYGKRPSGDTPIFLELKTHHEKWVNTKSIKERVSIRARDMTLFLSHTTKWDLSTAVSLIRSVEPFIKDKELDKAAHLLLRMHELVVKRNLRPCVRSRYSRVAFQSPKSNDLRLTIDRNIEVIDETSTPPGSWCLLDEAIEPHMIKLVPFDVFEVKLSGTEMPTGIQSFQERGVVIEAPKFSKFLSGAAAHNPTKISSLPYWAENNEFDALFNMGDCEQPSTCATEVSDISENKDRNVSKKDEVAADGAADGTRTNRWCSFRGKATAATAKIAPKRPARVEPKSFFAAERTMVQWASAGIFLVTVAVILLEFNETHSEYPLLAVGLVLLGCSALIVTYSAVSYRRRVQLLTDGASYGYIDHCGPLFLTTAILVGIVMVTVVFTTKKFDQLNEQRMNATRIAVSGNQCFLHPVEGVSRLEFQPSDVIFDSDTSEILVASLESIRAVTVSTAVLNGNVPSATRDVVTIPEADLEALTWVGNTVFAVSELGSRSSELIAFEWAEGKRELVVKERWEIPTPRAEGIAYIPELDGPGKLYIAGDLATSGERSTTERGFIDVYDVPSIVGTGSFAEVVVADDDVPQGQTSPSNAVIFHHRLNSRVLSAGLADSKIASLQYFEGILYILHDNSRLVRAWDMDAGNMISQWYLPRVDGQADKQWEGMALERRSRSSRSSDNLRGSGAGEESSLHLHLTLDSPPQVWSLAVEEESPGHIVLPGCVATR